MANESRQVRRARERAEAKGKTKQKPLFTIDQVKQASDERIKEIEQAQTQERPLIQTSDYPEYLPDAGVNSISGMENYYFFTLGEWYGQHLGFKKKTGRDIAYKRSYDLNGEPTTTLGMNVNIMDADGNINLVDSGEHTGLLLTAQFTADQLEEMAVICDNGAMNCRITGIPGDKESFRNKVGHYETIRVVRVQALKALGDAPGKVMHTFFPMLLNAPITSTQIADYLRRIKEQLVNYQPA